MSSTSKSFFRAHHVGSLLRPNNLLEARECWKEGIIDFKSLQDIEDACIKQVVELQENIGLDLITDGEFRRENWWADFIGKIDGVEISEGDLSSEFKTDGGRGSGFIPKVVKTVSRITYNNNVLGRDFRFLSECTSKTPKVTIPSPTRIHFHGGREAISKKIYRDMNEFWSDLARFYQQEIAALEEIGCRFIQIDDPILTYFIDERMRRNLITMGEDPAVLLKKYVALVNECIKNRKTDTHVALHLCRGNAASSWVASGGYSLLAPDLFPEIDVDSFFLEYDDDRSGDFEPLDLIPKGKKVVLGLITTKNGKLENDEVIKQRIEEASRYVPLSDLALSPQCGFASIDKGNIITFKAEISKLELVVRIAEEVWNKK